MACDFFLMVLFVGLCVAQGTRKVLSLIPAAMILKFDCFRTSSERQGWQLFLPGVYTTTGYNTEYPVSPPPRFVCFSVSQGVEEALLLMKVGDKWELTCSAELAFGNKGRPPSPGRPR